MDFKKGDAVEFSPTHNKALKLRGKVKEINEDGTLGIAVPADGKVVEVVTTFVAAAADCKAIEEPAKKDGKKVA